jgi:ornithine cyclodeaminase/alanine dehydrogenase-like protein (mu-crystallin family)
VNIEMLDAARVREVLPMPECIEAMVTAMTAVSDGRIAVPPRIIMPLVDGSGYFGVMPGSSADPLVYGAKVISLHPSNPARGLPAIQGFVVLFDHSTGVPVVLVEGATITALRTAAASGLATRELARRDATTLGLLGAGVQADSHLEAVCAVRAIREVRIWARSADKAREFARRHTRPGGPAIVAVDTPRDAAGCDVVCAVTGSPEPVLHGEWVQPGAHVNLVGAHTATTREADSALIARARVYVDLRESARNEAGDLLIAEREGAIGPDHVVGEIGEVLLGRVRGRRDEREVTVYKSLGIVAQDLVAAYVAWQRARDA